MSDTTSTPITAEGLRGLGMDVRKLGACIRIGSVTVEVSTLPNWPTRVYIENDAPDLEWVAAMIGLLRRANGGEG